MKYYLVKVTSTATAENPNFSGEVSITYHGKACVMVKREGTHLPRYNCDYTTPYDLKEYAYKRECDAKRSWDYKHLQNDRYWQSSAEIVAFEV